MSPLKISYPKGATPLDPDERAGLIPDYITTQEELNSLERENILDALTWAEKKRRESVVTASFAFELHKKMFGRVWKWAGKQRHSDKNIGVTWTQISPQISNVFKDLEHWIQNKTFSWDEIGARFHHRLVAIHVFSNGNGRHARLLTDLILEAHDQTPFTWRKTEDISSIEVEGPIRDEYIASLKEADQKKYDRLIRFARGTVPA